MANVKFVTLGCPKNEIDSEIMQSMLKKSGYSPVEELEKADFLVFNTCCFINDAREESIDAILEGVELKNKGAVKGLLVSGCLAQRYPEELMKEIPEIDGLVGTGNLDQISTALREVKKEKKPLYTLGNAFDYNQPLPRYTSENSFPATAYLRIAEGCDLHCSYCIIPALRGPYRSRPPSEIVKEAGRLEREGVREIILVAQDTTAYGSDFGQEYNLASLLKDLLQNLDIHWIRLLYSNPQELDDSLLQLLAEEERICSYLDLPLQHSVPGILKRMGRSKESARMEERLQAIRTMVPGITLRSTLMVGFPGESRQDFLSLLSFVKRVRFDRLGVFTYSQEEGTRAATLPGQIPKDVREERRKKIMLLQQKISSEINATKEGRLVEVLAEEIIDRDPRLLVGRTQGDAPEIDNQVVFTSQEGQPGQFLSVKVTASNAYELLGEESS